MSEAKHTPLPWHFSRKFRYVSDINHRVIAEISPLHGFEANAAFIVRAVNSHDALVQALEAALSIVSDRAAGGRMLTPKETASAVFHQMRAALAAAKDTP